MIHGRLFSASDPAHPASSRGIPAHLRFISFISSISGMMQMEIPMAAAYSRKVTGAKENALRRKGTNTTALVRASEKARVAHSHLFCFRCAKSDCLRDLMLNAWKISVMLSVRNAMVMPAGDWVISHVPSAI